MKFTSVILIILSVFVLFSCSIEDLFKQPEINVTGYTLLELPTDTAFLEIDMQVTNMDKRQVHIADVNYQVVLEGITLPEQHAILNMDIYPDSTINMTLPLSMVTSDAIKILAKLDAGEDLAYYVTGLFHVDDPVYKLFDLPLIVSGRAEVEAGYDDFYQMPSVTLDEISGTYTFSGSDRYVFDFEVSCLVHNNDPRDVTVEDVEYTIYIEGIPSEVHYLSNTYPGGISINGNADDSLTLPVSLTLDAETGAALALAIGDGNIEYTVEGLLRATQVDSLEIDFTLPLYIHGNTSADILSTLFVQPRVEIAGYSLVKPPTDTTYLNIDMVVVNRDTRSAMITDITYQVEIDSIMSMEETALVELNIGTYPLELTLPLTLLTSDAVKLLDKLDHGEELDYHATGTFHIDDPVLNQFDLPLDIEGTAAVDVGYEQFYVKPDITVQRIGGDFTQNEQGDYIFYLDVSCAIKNNDTRSVTLNEIEYRVNIEGINSNTAYYSDNYLESFTLAASATDSIVLPIVIEMDESQGSQLAQAMKDGMIDYNVEGLIYIIEVDNSPLAITLPMLQSGSIDSDIIAQLFAQPDIEVTGYELLELPGDTTHLNIKMLLTNNDTRTADIYDVNYQVVVDGISALPEHVVVEQTIPKDTITLVMPLRLLTDDAIQILDKLDAGESLPYEVTGTFHIDDPVLDEFDLPIDISGTATVDVGYEDFFNQPEVTVNNMSGNYHINGFTSYTITYDVNCTVQNLEARAATIDEIEYTVTIEGTKSAKHYYSNAYSSDFEIGASASENLTLPVTFNLNIANGAAMVSALSDGTVEYVIEGTFHVTLVDGTEADFTLPLYVTGSVPATMVAN